MTRRGLLAIETSTVACSVAAAGAGEIAVREISEPGAHASRIMPMIDDVLGASGLDFGSLAGIVYGRGPGSFTGVRIAVALAQGLAAGCRVPVLGVSSLALVAQRALDAHAAASVLVVQDARMGELYAGWYEADARGLARKRHDDALVAPDALAHRDAALAVGEALARMPELAARLAGDGVAIDADIARPGAAEALRLARAAPESAWVDAASASAVYLRHRVATPATA